MAIDQYFEDVMNTSKQIAYKVWLDELNTTPSEAFFPTFRQFLDLLIKENRTKIKILRDTADEGTKRLVKSANEAVKELEKLLEKLEKEAKKEKIKSLPEVDHFKQVKGGKIVVTGEDLPDTLYHAIRLTIESQRNEGKLKAFDDLLSQNENFWYLDYAKVCKSCPRYELFKDTKEEFERQRKEEPWGAYTYLRWATTFFKDVLPEQAGSFVKPEIINNSRRFILYLLTPEKKEEKAKPTKNIGIEGLFAVSENPTAIYYEGESKEKRGWVEIAGKIQPLAILKLAAEKYNRRLARDKRPPTQVRLSLGGVEDYLKDPKHCSRPPNWKSVISPRKRLENLARNIKRLVPFSDEELCVKTIDKTPFLFFQTKSNSRA